MHLNSFDYNLPPELIAHYPLDKRSHSRLLCLDRLTGEIQHHQFFELVDRLKPNDLLIFNNTRVIPARLFATKPTGGKVEILVEKILPNQEVMALLRSSKSPKIGARMRLENSTLEVEVINRLEEKFQLKFHSPRSTLDILNQYGHVPLPHYMDREDEAMDVERYQTVYAKEPGAVAAPTAGLHFDTELLQIIKNKGINIAYVTLHVGLGTFQPVRVDNIIEHQMHAEYAEVSAEVCEKIQLTRQKQGRIIAVGTTSVRSLETAALDGVLKPWQGETNIFIYPGFQFKVVDAMITNFHLPKSTLLMLVSAFAGLESILEAYRVAIEQKYRFFSYGDAMFIGRFEEKECNLSS